jgi:glutathione synthase/RimK-type ligase-like ATP-grasp enzyme
MVPEDVPFNKTSRVSAVMKKIGILHGRETVFPSTLAERINCLQPQGIHAEPIRIDKLLMGQQPEYDVLLDRISHDVPFYRALLKHAALNGTAVCNNPFYLSTEEKFMANVIASRIGVPVPKTALIPSNQHPPDTDEFSFRNLVMPLDWDSIFTYVGFPAYMKPHSGGGWKSVMRVNNPDEFFRLHQTTGQLVMMLQEAIEFEAYFRCYCIGQSQVHIMPYEPRNPHHLRYVASFKVPTSITDLIREYCILLNTALGYDFNTVEFAVRQGIPYAIDFTNPAPDCDPESVGRENFLWVVEAAARMLIEKAQEHQPGHDNLTWGTFLRTAMEGNLICRANLITTA